MLKDITSVQGTVCIDRHLPSENQILDKTQYHIPAERHSSKLQIRFLCSNSAKVQAMDFGGC